jgi:hypothetical protein
MNGIRVVVRRSLAEQMKLPHSNISSYLNRNVSINKAHSTNRMSRITRVAHASDLKGPDFENSC